LVKMLKFAVLSILLVAGASALPRVSRRVPGGGKIVGGEDAREGQFPYQLSLRWLGSHICGASIISETLAVTAAHCVDGDSPSAIQVVAGKHRRTTTGPNEQNKQVTRINVHPEYDDYYFANDIALLTLSSSDPLVFNDFVKAIPLPAKEQQTTGDIIVSGWGAIRQGGAAADILQYVQIPTIDDVACQKLYPDERVLSSMLCAGLPQGGKDSCQGDSGGPLAAVDGGYLAGIVSWGYGCAQPNYPGVNTEVSYFIDFINANRAFTGHHNH